MDADGNITYEIAGRWSTQLVARAVGTGFGALHPDVNVSVPSSPSASQEFILLWRNTEKPHAPSNFTLVHLPNRLTFNVQPKVRTVTCATSSDVITSA